MEAFNKQNRTSLFCIVLVFCLFAASIFSATLSKKGASTASEKKWRDTLIKWRKDKDLHFKESPVSPMAGVERFSLPKVRCHFNRTEKGYELSRKKGKDLMFVLIPFKSTWKLGLKRRGIVITQNGELVASGDKLNSRTLIKIGEETLLLYPLTSSVVLTRFSPDRKSLKEFRNLKYFAPDRNFVFTAKLTRFEKPEKVILLTSRNLEKTFFKHARLSFDFKGKTHQLTAFVSDLGKTDGVLFVPFADATSGKTTYEVGRYLEIASPGPNHCVLDFNYAFNPLCNYSPAYNCAMPPAENIMTVSIKAGEKAYPDH